MAQLLNAAIQVQAHGRDPTAGSRSPPSTAEPPSEEDNAEDVGEDDAISAGCAEEFCPFEPRGQSRGLKNAAAHDLFRLGDAWAARSAEAGRSG